MPEAHLVKNKPFWKSKTFWFNALILGTSVVTTLPVSPEVVTIITTVGNLIIRKTSDGGRVTILPEKDLPDKE